MLRNTPKDKEIKQLLDYILRSYLAIHLDAQAFPGKLVQDGQYL
jgi:hypothetical protein